MNREEVYKLIEEHYRTNSKRLVKRFSGVGRSRHNSEDLVQEAYTRALQYWKSFNAEKFSDENSFDKWFMRIVVNCMKDKIKEEKEHGAVSGVDVPADVRPNVLNRLIIEDVRKIIAKEAENIRYILTLFFFEQYKGAEIAEIVPESHSYIRLLIHNFRKHLRDEMRGTPIFERSR